VLDRLVARADADPTSACIKQMSYRETKRYLADLGDAMAGDQTEGTSQDQPPQLGHLFSKSEFFRRPLTAEAIAALVENLTKGRLAGRSRELDFTPWGGAYMHRRPDGPRRADPGRISPPNRFLPPISQPRSH
jgi:hypothetical protein